MGEKEESMGPTINIFKMDKLMSSMGFLTVFLSISLGMKIKESKKTECTGNIDADVKNAEECTKNAAQQYMEEMFEDVPKGIAREIPKDYNKPDYYARKTCNYLTSVGELCYSCLPQHVIRGEKDKLIKQVLHTTKDIPNFDAKKCPISKDYLKRNSTPKVNMIGWSILVLIGILTAVVA